MKILVLEYITGGMRQEPIAPLLAQEGEQMLVALTDDLLAWSDANSVGWPEATAETQQGQPDLVVFRDDRLP